MQRFCACLQVYPCALHNRFVHSLGVAHMANQWTDFLLLERAKDLGFASFEFNSRDVVLAAAAGNVEHMQARGTAMTQWLCYI